MALSYDFYLTAGAATLGFNTAISKDRPYERATAQFKKDQQDTTATVGDQSLTGWWTRGQFSFHGGAGVKYYEVLGDSDDTVANRFLSSTGSDVWTPGEVTIARAFSSVTTLANPIVHAAPGHNYILAALTDGTVHKVTTSGETDITPGTGGAVWSVAGDGSVTWIVQDATIYSYDGTTLTAQATAGAGVTFRSCWYAKDRLFIVDSDGRWYTAAPLSATTINTADTFWASKLPTGPELWHLAESPAAVYLGREKTICQISLDTDGLVPSVTNAGIAALLPTGETLTGMVVYLGYLLVCTTEGFRVAVLQGDGSLTYGPLVAAGVFGSREIATGGNYAYPVGVLEGSTDTSVLEVDLSTMVGPLRPAYSRRNLLSGSGREGTVRARDFTLFAYEDSGLVLREVTTLRSSSTLTTGFHRLGTLESKAFRLLRVKAEGTEGSIDVSVNASDGASYYVGNLPAGSVADFDLAAVSGFPDVLEYISITFSLNRGTFTGPTLLGYQLKALPVPKRQRMIRVPLMLFDEERNRLGEQQYADAWDRLAALEDLEQSNAVVTFEDKETGETGSGYIEAVEVSRTSPGAHQGGFGGTIYLTIRKL